MLAIARPAETAGQLYRAIADAGIPAAGLDFYQTPEWFANLADNCLEARRECVRRLCWSDGIAAAHSPRQAGFAFWHRGARAFEFLLLPVCAAGP